MSREKRPLSIDEFYSQLSEGHERVNKNGLDSLPPGWALTTLDEVVKINPRQWNSPTSDEDFVSFVPMADVEAGTGKMFASQQRLWREVKKGYTPFQEGDLLFAKITPCMENGKCAIANGLVNSRGAGSTEFHVLRPSEAIQPVLLLHFLLRQSYRRDARMSMKGAAGQLRVPDSFLAATSLGLPPINEQKRIVTEIEKQFSRLDAAVTALKRVQSNLKHYRNAVLRAACEGRLVPTEAELARQECRDYESADVLLQRILSDRRNQWETEQLAKLKVQGRLALNDTWKSRYQEPISTDISGVSQLPEGWCWTSFGHLCGVQGGFAFKSSDYVSTGIPLIRISNLVKETVTIQQDTVCLPTSFLAKYKSFGLRKGDTLIAMSGATTGKTAVYKLDTPAILNQRVGRFKITNDSCSPAYVNILVRLSTKQVMEDAYGAAQPNISPSQIEQMLVPLPPIAEQERIVLEVERRLSILDETEATVAAGLKRAERLRQAILQHAFAGKLVPQDPTDEPASVLLERIRADREGKQSVNAPAKRKGGKRASAEVYTPNLF